MISIKSDKEIESMRMAGAITAAVLDEISKHIRPGISTAELDKIANMFIISKGAKPAFLRYNGFPNTICASVDDEVVHGIPKPDKILTEGQIISIDVGAKYHGFCGDAARTFAVGTISDDKQRLLRVTKECYFEAIKNLKDGSRVGDIGAAIAKHAEKFGFQPVTSMGGHGIGKSVHEDPYIPNFGRIGTGEKLKAGMVVAIEPMINMGTHETIVSGWGCKTADGMPSAHYENTVLILANGVEILTKTADLEANNLE